MGDKLTLEQEQLFMDNIRLVNFVIKKHFSRISCNDLNIEYEDLEQEGYVGLVIAVKRYDANSGNKFSTFATLTIWGIIKQFLNEKTDHVHVPRGIKELKPKILKNGLQDATAEEISEKIGVSLLAAKKYIEYNRVKKPVHFEKKIYNDERSITIYDTLSYDFDYETSCDFEIFMSGLDEREKRVFSMFLEEKSGKQIGKVMGFTQQNAGIITRRVKSKAQDYFRVI